jgi:hypothetical protein
MRAWMQTFTGKCVLTLIGFVVLSFLIYALNAAGVMTGFGTKF